jgi:hypothetical protein
MKHAPDRHKGTSMAAATKSLDRGELAAVVRRADPAAVLVPPRILRRVIKQARSVGGIGLQIPHRKCLVIGRKALLGIAGRSEIGIAADCELPETVLLLAEMDAAQLKALPAEEVLRRYWRLLFHARVHAELEQHRARGGLSEVDVRLRAVGIGRADLNAAAEVLRRENLLLPPGDLDTVYEEFAAVYLDVRHFEPQRLDQYFPLARQTAIDGVLAQDVDAQALLTRTRPEGAAGPTAVENRSPETAEAEPLAIAPKTQGGRTFARLRAAAARSRGRGNLVRAAIRSERAARVGTESQSAEARRAAGADLEHLAARLRKALDLVPTQAAALQGILLGLLKPAAGGLWTVEGRLLYDLQKVCLDDEREVYAVDVVEWVVSGFRRPLRRHLPHQRQVLVLKHLRQAVRRLPGARLAADVREQLHALLHDAVRRCEEHLRDRFRPAARAALDEVGLVGRNRAESVARAKVVEELLDRVVERDLLTMSDLRDAVARNRVKLPDLAGPDEFLLGDKLIRANRALARHLDGVYHRGEIYLRWLQRLSSTAFGTRVGRALTLFVVLPFGGAFMILEGYKAILHELPGHHARHTDELPAHLARLTEELPGQHARHVHDSTWLANRLYGEIVPTAVLGVFLLGVLHSAVFRQFLLDALTGVRQTASALIHQLPAFLARLPFVRKILESRLCALLYPIVFRPLLLTAPVTLGLYVADYSPLQVLAGSAGVFLTTSLLLNSPLGLHVEEALTDQVGRIWQLLGRDLVPGLYFLVVGVFRTLMEGLERILYAVDEWFRFRTGDSKLSATVKPILGLAWFVVAYSVRAVINLFVEPTFNPIKHFPVVTVAAKLLIPFFGVLLPALTTVTKPVLGVGLAGLFAGTVIIFIPGFAGFLVWELKENWRLYEANQPATLRPLVVGSHGETVRRLLRPGFHSGTVPKLFAKLRRADGPKARKREEELHHVALAVERFLDRDFLAMLEHSPLWGHTLRLRCGQVRLGTNRIRFELRCRDLPDPPLNVDVDIEGAYLLAGVSQAGWIRRLSERQRRALAEALAGFYRLAGVDLVREQVDRMLPRGAAYVATETGLCVWSADCRSESQYPLNHRAASAEPSGSAERDVNQLLLQTRPIRWVDWAATLEEEWAKHANDRLAADRVLPQPLFD